MVVPSLKQLCLMQLCEGAHKTLCTSRESWSQKNELNRKEWPITANEGLDTWKFSRYKDYLWTYNIHNKRLMFIGSTWK